jgi:hypothetical protein
MDRSGAPRNLAPHQAARNALQIVENPLYPKPLILDELPHLVGLSGPQFKQEVSSRDQSGRELRRQLLVELQTAFAAE